jgi:adenosylcobyric acid synthase
MGALRIAEEDSLNVDARTNQHAAERALTIAVLRLPRIANHDEFQPFEHEPDVALRFTDDPIVAASADLLIVPGTKSTVADLAWLREQGLDHVIRLRAQRQLPVLGVCGGCQMLGRTISDPDGVESTQAETDGIGLLALNTRFLPTKNTRRVRARKSGESWLFAGLSPEVEVPGYFIHAGITSARGAPALESLGVDDVGASWQVNGATSDNGAVVGTMVHGLFEHDGLRHSVLDRLRTQRGLGPASGRATWDRQAEYDRLAEMIRDHADTRTLDALVGLQ